MKQGIDVTLDDGTIIKAEELTGEPLKGRKIVYLGDTSDASNLIDAAKDCDILIHEATTDDARLKDCAKLGHATPLVAARMGLRCNARRLGDQKSLILYVIMFPNITCTLSPLTIYCSSSTTIIFFFLWFDCFVMM